MVWRWKKPTFNEKELSKYKKARCCKVFAMRYWQQNTNCIAQSAQVARVTLFHYCELLSRPLVSVYATNMKRGGMYKSKSIGLHDLALDVCPPQLTTFFTALGTTRLYVRQTTVAPDTRHGYLIINIKINRLTSRTLRLKRPKYTLHGNVFAAAARRPCRHNAAADGLCCFSEWVSEWVTDSLAAWLPTNVACWWFTTTAAAASRRHEKMPSNNKK